MNYSKRKFNDANEVARFVLKCEADFELRLQQAVDEVCSVENLRVVGLSGPTCSGKTTTAKKLISGFSKLGRRVHVVSIDDFFKDSIRVEADDDNQGTIDYDSLDAIDFEEFKRCTENILEGNTVRIPKFDFVTGRRAEYTEFNPDPTDLYIFEGIQAIYPEIIALLNKVSGKSVYICVEEPIDIEGEIFSPTEIRLMRRIVRDYNFRGSSPEYTMFLWESVRANEDKNIFPYVEGCDIRINSTMPYEINLLVQFIRPLLEAVPKISDYYDEASELLRKLNGIDPIAQSFIPDNSLYYEFIKRIL